MSIDPKYLLEVIPRGNGWALDLGGGRGGMRTPLCRLGYKYVNLDIHLFDNGEPSIVGSAHKLPFKDEVFDLVVSKDSLEHFLDPWMAVKEVYRVLKPGGLFIIWVPFMHPFHGDDTYRYTPLGLQHLLRDFTIMRFESPLWVFTVVGMAIISFLKILRLGIFERPIRKLCAWADRLFMKRATRPMSFAAAYRVVAKKPLVEKNG